MAGRPGCGYTSWIRYVGRIPLTVSKHACFAWIPSSSNKETCMTYSWRYLRYVPGRQIAIKRVGTLEHLRHFDNRWHVPCRHISIEGETVSCILCNADGQLLLRLVSGEIGLCVQKGWYLHETNCTECGVMLMSSAVDGPMQCIVCDKVH
jgi:hypothetical protein